MCQHPGMRPVAALAAVALALPACAPAARELAPGPPGPDGVRSLIESLAGRFGPVEREPAFDALRPKLARAALVPSRVFDDAEAWTARDGERRQVELAGWSEAGSYRIGVRAPAPRPGAPGEYRGRVRLERLGRGRFEWWVEEELATGGPRPADLAAGVGALLRGAGQAGEAQARAAIHQALPRATQRLSRLFRIERLSLERDAHGATTVRLALRLAPDGVRPFAPRYAGFLDKYFGPMKLRAAATDEPGREWWRLEAADGLWTATLRVQDGSLVPLEGSADRRIPGVLRVDVDYATRMGRFDVGVRGLVVQLGLIRTPREKGFLLRFLEEPDWKLPFLVEPLIRGPLHYPFEDPGSESGWSAREAGPGDTRFVRHYRARVRESWVLRWFGGMTSGALAEFRREAEREADLYHRECLLALRDDLAALVRAP
jgi:hypothetical protein